MPHLSFTHTYEQSYNNTRIYIEIKSQNWDNQQNTANFIKNVLLFFLNIIKTLDDVQLSKSTN